MIKIVVIGIYERSTELFILIVVDEYESENKWALVIYLGFYAHYV
jgi:hypothetical protein